MYSVLNTLGDYTYMYIQKNITLYTFCLKAKLLKTFLVEALSENFQHFDTRMKFGMPGDR